MKRGKWGFCDKNIKLQIPYDFDDVHPFVDGLAIVSRDGLYGVIDKNNEMIIPFYYEELSWLECGCLRMKKDNLYGLISKENRVMVPAEYEYLKMIDGPFVQLRVKDEMAWYDPFAEKFIWKSKNIRQ
jgi:hypothetical protein